MAHLGLLAVYRQRHRREPGQGGRLKLQPQVPLVGHGEDRLAAAMVRARESRREDQLFDDLSAKPDICNLMTAGSTGYREPKGEPTQAGDDRRRATMSDS